MLSMLLVKRRFGQQETEQQQQQRQRQQQQAEHVASVKDVATKAHMHACCA
jgi:hypothetical protein